MVISIIFNGISIQDLVISQREIPLPCRKKRRQILVLMLFNY